MQTQLPVGQDFHFLTDQVGDEAENTAISSEVIAMNLADSGEMREAEAPTNVLAPLTPEAPPDTLGPVSPTQHQQSVLGSQPLNRLSSP